MTRRGSKWSISRLQANIKKRGPIYGPVIFTAQQVHAVQARWGKSSSAAGYAKSLDDLRTS